MLHMIDLGPAPLLLSGGRVTELAVSSPAPPLGLGALTGGAYHVGTTPFAPGDVLVLSTDGVIEARNGDGAFYPLAERVTSWGDAAPDRLRHILHDDLLAHAGGSLGDDATMIAIERVPEHSGVLH
ncbi:PP2C family protein-serine/threonine phosphatase [Streptomyces sp. 8N616]|uniref:PP2C family protein-serine/threonine phosphatase n=1 Tax=Streptomyces sp. 8N616 TaxID=3457414 RepID=UPI003FCFE31A